MTTTLERGYDNFEISLKEYTCATELTRSEKAQKLLSQVDILAKTRDGIQHLYQKSLSIESAGIFENTAWKDPGRLTPALVKGTLVAGHPSSGMEILSELRMLSYATKESSVENAISAEEAGGYLEEVLVHNLEFAFQDLSEETRTSISTQETKKVYNLFGLILSEISLDGIKDKLAEEIHLICEQRPVVTRKVRELIHLINGKMELDPAKDSDKELLFYVNAVMSPTPLTIKFPEPEQYAREIKKLNGQQLEEEIEEMAETMRSTGLATPFLAMMLLWLVTDHPDYIPKALRLNKRGEAEWSKHRDLVIKLIHEIVSIDSFQCIYGLARLLERSLLSRNAVKASLNNLRMISINSQVEKRIYKCHTNKNASAKQYLIAATIRVLGQPLGIGQGNNSTCQSARGISMWSQHSAAKLINMIITVAAQNNLIFRFENTDLESNKLIKGLVDKLDYNLDAVSAVLVPHLDKIYNEMMRLASGRGEDPHKWVNPALYGHWIQIGFASAYSYLTNSIQDYNGFVALFYAAFHPEYNGGREMVYPNPIGIFVTSKSGAMIGFHAVSLLHVEKDPEGVMRIYFLNPNNEGRQNWGQDIKPSVYGNGERHGESSLPFHQFAARSYAFHFNSLETKDYINDIPDKEIEKVKNLAKESWGKSYIWSELKKSW